MLAFRTAKCRSSGYELRIFLISTFILNSGRIYLVRLEKEQTGKNKLTSVVFLSIFYKKILKIVVYFAAGINSCGFLLAGSI